MIRKSISVIIPSFNEEANIPSATENVLRAVASAGLDDYEIILFDDCSTDKTGSVIDGLAATNNHIKVIHNKENMGFGYNFNKGVELATKDYINILPGDNEIELKGIQAMFNRIGICDVIVPYVVNRQVRSFSRRLISGVYVFMMNLFFGCALRYYTGPAVLKADILKSVPLKTNDFAFMSAILVRTIRQGCSFIEVPISIRSRIGGKSKAFRIKNIVSVFLTILKLFWEVNISGRGIYNKKKARLAS